MNTPYKLFFKTERKVGIYFNQACICFLTFFNAKLGPSLSRKHSTSMLKQPKLFSNYLKNLTLVNHAVGFFCKNCSIGRTYLLV